MSDQDRPPVAAPPPAKPVPHDPTKVQTNGFKPGQEIKIDLDVEKANRP
jgi:hypothetical protein